VTNKSNAPARRRHIAMAALMLAWAAAAHAQGAVGSGPLTEQLSTSDPQTNVISLGRVKLAPGVTISEIGKDDNVFNEPVDPKDDFVAAGTVDVAAFSLLRFAQISVYAGSQMQYFQKYESERDIGWLTRGRIDFLLSRVRPFVGGGYTRTRTRPNGEIDVRADLKNEEVSGGLAFELSPHAVVFGSAIQTFVDYVDAFQQGVSLDQSLTRDGNEYMVGLKTDLTPLSSLQLRGSWKEDRFRNAPTRNGKSTSAEAVFSFAPQAFMTGAATFGYQDYVPVDPQTEPYRGLTGAVFLTFPLWEIARLNVGFNRGMEYSFDQAEAYYISTSYNAAYTHRLFGAVDAQVRGDYATYDYGNSATVPEHTDWYGAAEGSVGYNLRNRTRVALSYEYARRRSPALPLRNYDRRRVFLSWAFAY
jgi:hypothetical protein